MEIALFFDGKSGSPLYQQVASGLQNLIVDGKLTPGSKLPSSRELADSLGISRWTTSRAYEELSRQGYIESLPATGTFVRRNLAGIAQRALAQVVEVEEVDSSGIRLSSYGERLITSRAIESADVELYPELNFCAPAPEQLPVSKWRDMLVQATRKREFGSDAYIMDVFGHEGLRRVLADYLMRVRGINCTHKQIILFSGAQSALDLLSRILIDPGDLAVVENPGFPGARRTFASYGAFLSPIPVDDDGLIVEQLRDLEPNPKVLYTTPSHHDPTGASLSMSRRRALLEWAAQSGTLIIEDDFDSEYRYSEKPILALQAADKAGSVIYLSSFWKILFPFLRLGFAVVPPKLIGVLRRAKSLVERDFYFVEHEALTQFIAEGHLERHIRRTRAVYASRRQQLIMSLNKYLGATAKISPVSSGTHLIVKFNSQIADSELLSLAQRAALPVVSTGAYYLGEPTEREFMIPFGHLDEETIARSIEAFAGLIESDR